VSRVYELVQDQNEHRLVEVGGGISVALANGRLMPFSKLCQRAAVDVPMECVSGQTEWSINISKNPAPDDLVLEVPERAELVARAIVHGDCWYGSARLVMDDLRTSGIHPLLRTRLLAVAGEDGVLLIPAIYPTIRKVECVGPVKKVGIRWGKRT
jgi:hypothetical protein